jgi:hypothetical protein
MIVILNLVSLSTWSYSFIQPVRIKYVTTRLKLILIRHLRKTIANNDTRPTSSINDDSLLYRDDSHADFARNYLKCDGTFVLRLLETNTSDFVVTHVIEELFYSYEKKASQPVVLDGLAKMMSTLGPDQGLLSLGKLLFLPVMSDPKIAASFGGTFTLNTGPASTSIQTMSNETSRMLLPSLPASSLDDPLRHAPKLLVPPTPTRRRSSTATHQSQARSSSSSLAEPIDPSLRSSSSPAKPSVNEITEILRERRQRIKGNKH